MPVETINRSEEAISQVLAHVHSLNIQAVYVGLPRHLNGSEGAAAAAARDFASHLVANIGPVLVYLVDERMTTVAADRALAAAGRKARKRRDVVDQVAAVAILQTALDYEKTMGKPLGERMRAYE